jgi:2-methylcitrate dehydratase PrpD
MVEAETTDGKTLAVRCEHPRGSPENRLTRAQIEEKFRTYARGTLPAAHVEEVISTVARLEDLKSARRLMDILRAGGDQRARRTA